VTASPRSFSKKYGPMILEEDKAHQTVTLEECSGFWWSWRGFVSLQYLKFYLLTYPDRWKWASSLIHKLWTISSFSLIKAKNCSQKYLRLTLSFSLRAWTTWILYGWWWRSSCKILLTVRFDNPSVALWRRPNQRGLLPIASLTRSIFSWVHILFSSTSLFNFCVTLFEIVHP
jgi:hypothetical protein